MRGKEEKDVSEIESFLGTSSSGKLNQHVHRDAEKPRCLNSPADLRNPLTQVEVSEDRKNAVHETQSVAAPLGLYVDNVIDLTRERMNRPRVIIDDEWEW